MIKSIPTVFLIYIFSLLSPLKAEDSNEKISFNMAIGYAHPAKPELFVDFWQGGISFGLGASYDFSPNINAGVELNYHIFVMRDQRYLDAIGEEGLFSSVSSGSRYVLTIGGNLKWLYNNFSQYYPPYIVGGLGFLNTRITSIVKVGPDLKELNNEVNTYAASIPLGLGVAVFPREPISLSI